MYRINNIVMCIDIVYVCVCVVCCRANIAEMIVTWTFCLLLLKRVTFVMCVYVRA